MAQLFPKRVNDVPRKILIGLIVIANTLIFSVWYFFAPEFTDVGYAPQQPVAFSHQIHAGKLGLDCQYCHTQVFESKYANIPATQTCMNCHSQIRTDYATIAPIRESWETGKPIEWIKVSNFPDYAYFNHSAHVNVGVGCETCHGRIDRMEVVYQAEPLSMSWCLDCHRAPEKYIRPVEEVTTMGYTAENQIQIGLELVAKHNIHAPTYCQGCHY